jgi:hypothetical protein
MAMLRRTSTLEKRCTVVGALWFGMMLALCVGPPKAAHAAEGFTARDYFLAPVRVHLWQSPSESDLCTTLTESDVTRVLAKVNRVWAPAGICFYLEGLVREEPGEKRAESGSNGRESLDARVRPETHSAKCLHVYYIKNFRPNGICFAQSIFVKDTASLQPVEGGIDEPLPRVTAHELGHAFGLPHRQDRINLMASGTTGTELNAPEIAMARRRAEQMQFVRHAVDLATQAKQFAENNASDSARALYAVLANIAIDDEFTREMRARAAETRQGADNVTRGTLKP